MEMCKLKKTRVEENVMNVFCKNCTFKQKCEEAFYYVTDGKMVEKTSHQFTKNILCHVNPVNVLNLKTKKRKGLITYYKSYGITILKKHVSAYHSMIIKNLKKSSPI
jgi:hypothetical protein